MAPGIAESGQTDKYNRFGGDILTITMPIGGKDASINNKRPRQVAAQDIEQVLAAPSGKTGHAGNHRPWNRQSYKPQQRQQYSLSQLNSII